ncbi:N-acetyl sugar amidotransferase [Candidatus Thioglobus sp.]|nr:N-acetyl sugar amidotransferase [Candidatus Thioglobus sp.]
MEKNNMNTKHGLPEKVIFCKRCLMSNQRPSSSPELRKTSSDIKTAGFSDDGICDACNYYDFKKKMDWEDREKQLKDLCDKFRRNDGRYDVVVPGSGGKDSIAVSHLLKYKYNMNPLTVTWAPHIYTDVGWRNMQNWLKAGFDNILVTPNPKVHAILTRLSFENLVNPFQPFIIGQRNIAPRIAAQHDIQFVMYGENQAEAHNSFNENMSPLMGVEHFSRESLDDELFFGGISMKDLPNHGVPLNELNPYLPILKENFIKKEIEVHYMSYYINWSPQANYYYAKEHANFESNPDGRSEGTYSKYASIDDRLDGQHYFTMYAKFGQGRTMNDANRDIRDGFISREEGLALMNKYDGEFPQKYFQETLDYMGITEERYWEVIDNSRSPHLWKKIGGKWTLLHPTC